MTTDHDFHDGYAVRKSDGSYRETLTLAEADRYAKRYGGTVVWLTVTGSDAFASEVVR